MYSGIALGGRAGSGKTVVSARLAHLMGDRGGWPVLLSFGFFLKKMVLEETGLRKEDPGGREALLAIGDREREKDPDVFVKQLSAAVDLATVAGCTPIVTDVRRWNEWDWCDRAGFYTVCLEAPEEDRMRRLGARGEQPAHAHSDHPTETELSSFPWNAIRTNGDRPGDLFAAVSLLADNLLECSGL